MRYHILSISVLSALLLNAVPTMAADTNTMSINMPTSSNMSMNNGVSLQDATKAALAHTAGKALKVEHEREDGKPIYEVEIVHDGKITESHVDAMSGKVIASRTEKAESRIKALFLSDKKVNALQTAKISLADAAAKAEDTFKAMAVRAKFEHKDDKYVYEVTLRNAEDKHIEVSVDANSGAVMDEKR